MDWILYDNGLCHERVKSNLLRKSWKNQMICFISIRYKNKDFCKNFKAIVNKMM